MIRWIPIALVASAAGCSDPVQRELFDNTRDDLARNVGRQCTLLQSAPPDEEIAAVEESSQCRPGFCLGLSLPEATGGVFKQLCSCLCDGPSGNGPFCSCPDQFRCSARVLQNDNGISRYSGSYCIPD